MSRPCRGAGRERVGPILDDRDHAGCRVDVQNAEGDATWRLRATGSFNLSKIKSSCGALGERSKLGRVGILIGRKALSSTAAKSAVFRKVWQ
jgi:hypothetical protein